MHESQLRETCWRVVEGPSGRLVVCAIYETATADFELRVGYAADRPFHIHRLADAESARARARQWLSVLRAAGCVGSITDYDIDARLSPSEWA
jgi:hypothetical protein